ncbi:MAG: hypothetical protein D6773_08565 [Alphaproteobacteria bacterium]|nr:MAG: hypothetical protein D6773_08565 [Alphaproteobacteria bacterium]
MNSGEVDRIAKALEAGGMPELAANLRERMALEGPAPWRKVVEAKESVGLTSCQLTETLECGHRVFLESKSGSPVVAKRRRCQACQDDMRRAAGWSEETIRYANEGG